MEKSELGQNFDLRVHIRNKKTGHLEKINPYRLKISNGISVFMRDGRKYSANGEEIITEQEKKTREKESLLSRAQKLADAARIEEKKVQKAEEACLKIEIEIDDAKKDFEKAKSSKASNAEELREKLKTLEQKYKEAENKHSSARVSSASVHVSAREATDAAKNFTL